MANTQQKAIAAGFMHALQDPATFAKWQAAQGDSDKLRALIQETLGLAQPPSVADMEAMRAHAEAELQAQHEKVLAAQPSAPRTVGFAYTMQS